MTFFNQIQTQLLKGYSILFTPLRDNGSDTGWDLIIRGLGVTLQITFFAVFLGVIIGTVIALMRLSRFKVLNVIARVYTEIIRGTPVLVQLMIIYFVIFATTDIPKIVVAIIAFAINSGAYISEIIRAGIQAVDKGQTEAARSLGMSPTMTMGEIILPQAIRNILPALANEFIILLKETSVVGFIGGRDLMRAGDQIRSITYNATTPLLIVAVIYFIMTFALSLLIGALERRLHRDKR